MSSRGAAPRLTPPVADAPRGFEACAAISWELWRAGAGALPLTRRRAGRGWRSRRRADRRHARPRQSSARRPHAGWRESSSGPGPGWRGGRSAPTPAPARVCGSLRPQARRRRCRRHRDGRGWLTRLAKAHDDARARHQSRQDGDPRKHICPVTAQMLHDDQGSQVQRWTAGESYRLNTSDLHPIYCGGLNGGARRAAQARPDAAPRRRSRRAPATI